MADLDDFFAKKDKKKGKSKKYISSDELVRQLEQPAVTKEETKVENSELKTNLETTVEVRCELKHPEQAYRLT
jgi:hypothetical protein